MKRNMRMVLCLILMVGFLFPASVYAADYASVQSYAEDMPSIYDVKLKDICIGYRHSLAIDANGEVWAWGENYFGQLGGGFLYNDDGLDYVKVLNLTDVVQVAVGEQSSYALKADGTVWAWGGNWQACLGDGTVQDRSVPVQVKNLTDIVQISAGPGNHCAALKADGTVWCWGYNVNGTLGNNSTRFTLTPVQSDITDVTKVTVSQDNTYAIKADGTVWAWGLGDYMGAGGTLAMTSSPVQLTMLKDIIQISVSDYHGLALQADGTVWAWGSNHNGQVGDGTTNRAYMPVQLGLKDIISVHTTYSSSLAQQENGSVLGWGNSSHGTMGSSYLPHAITTPTELRTFWQAARILTGPMQTVFIQYDGSIWACGSNQFGELKPGYDTQTIYDPIMLFEPGTYIGRGAALPDEHTVTVIERYLDGSADAKHTYTAPKGDAFYAEYTADGTIQSVTASAADAGVHVDFAARALSINAVNRNITITLVFDTREEEPQPPEPQTHTVTITEIWADEAQPDQITSVSVSDGASFYRAFAVPSGYTGSCTATGTQFSYNAGNGAVYIGSVTMDTDIVITYTPDAPQDEPTFAPDAE